MATQDPPIRVGALRMAMVLLGYCLSLPVIMVGAQLGGHLGVAAASRAFLTGCGVLTIVGVLTACIGVRARLTTYEIIAYPFGVRGAHIVNGVIGTTIIGWFAVTLAVFARAVVAGVQQMFDHPIDATPVIVLGAGLMIVTALRGFRALAIVSRITVPAMGLFLMWAAYLASGRLGNAPAREAAPGDVDQAVSLVVGVYIVGVSLLPDITRFARTARSAVLAVVLALGIALPLILMASMLPAVATGCAEMTGMFVALGLGAPALLVVVAAAWTSNASNLYSASLTVLSIVPRMPSRIVVVGAGLAGTGLALLDMGDLFVRFLSLLSVAIPPISGIIIADHLLRRRHGYDLDTAPIFGLTAFAAWGGGIALAFLMQAAWPAGFALPAVNSILAAFFVYAAFTVAARVLSHHWR